MYYTLGQRKGLQIGGVKHAQASPWYVIDKDVKNNILIVGQGTQHPRLYRQGLHCHDLTWVNETEPTYPLTCSAKTRYRQDDAPCIVTKHQEATLVMFADPQRAITPGQSVVFYQNTICLGGGVISEGI